MKFTYTLSAILLFLLFSSTTIFSQETEKWVKVDSASSPRLYIDVKGIERFTDDDIYIWTMENHNPSLVIESVDGKIFKTKTYYLVNKKLKKYSILQIIYYDGSNNVLDDFNYKLPSENEAFKYNYPIMPNSDMEAVLNRALEYINKGLN
ncbi:MAG: hypothetical protein K9J16_01760 [Melioribacteraceae bacterium]|nr:hypothetical protein [Melioribacteraceae bacterium]MCF8352992.1 hypothetical protein [Melioribacteraceae bacterium]MCF8392883.1 hypothetical protein [Melioribacteraceae bacterium]MCF8417823.1 hypothetical protein [Melioribacteraceae bacterium]